MAHGAEGQQLEQRRIPWWISYIAAPIAVGTALVYFLGRLYLEGYYEYFGIAPGVLSFSTQDYMFSSFPILMMVIGTIPGLFQAYVSLTQWQPFSVDITKPWRLRWIDVFWITFLTAVSAYITYSLFAKTFLPFTIPALTGLLVGLAIGFLFIPTTWLFQILCVENWWSRDTKVTAGTYHIIMLVLYLFSFMPFLAGGLAEGVAMAKLERLPQVTIACDQLPTDLQPLAEGEGQCIAAKLVLVNNGWVYFFNESNGKSSNGHSQLEDRGRVYSIKVSDTKYIIYDLSYEQGK